MKALSVVLFLTFYHSVYSQTSHQDTVQLARQLSGEQKFAEANDLLAVYNAHHTDVEALKQQAQLLYWIKRPKDAEAVYQRAYSLFPDHAALQQEYATFLFDNKKFLKARSLLNASIKTDSLNIESMRMLAYIDLWTGRISEARQKASWLQQHQPEGVDAHNILKTIETYTSPYIVFSGGVYSDDQPMKRYSFEVEGGVYRSWLFAPYIGASLHQFNIGEAKRRTKWIRGGNKIYLAQTKTDIDMALGTFYARDRHIGTTWKVKVGQKISSAFSVDGAVEERPYQYTLSSIQAPFLYRLSELGLNYNRKDRWLGRAAYQSQSFFDNNEISTVYAWLLAPIINKTKLSIKAGYGFSTADSKKNTFKAKDMDVSTTSPGSKIQGIYDPYFTPFDQTVHSVLTTFIYAPTTRLSFSTNVSVGVIASAYLPYHYVEGNSMGQLFIGKQYVAHDYTPVDLAAAIKYTASKRLYFHLQYQYNSLIFFKSHFVNLQLKYVF